MATRTIQIGTPSAVSASAIATGTLPAARMGSGGATGRVLRFDNTWVIPPTVVTLVLSGPQTSDPSPSTGSLRAVYRVPAALNGARITAVVASVTTTGTGATTVQIVRNRAGTNVNALSTVCQIDSTATSSSTSGTPAVIDSTNSQLQTDDLLSVTLDAVASGIKGLIVTLTLGTP